MVMPPSIPTVLGALAVFATAALIAVHAILAHELGNRTSSSTRIVAIVSCALEGVVFSALCIYLLFHLRRRPAAEPINYKCPQQQPQSNGPLLGLTIILCTVAAAVSVAALVCLGKEANKLPEKIFGAGAVPFLVGASVTLGVSYAAQLLFLIVCFIACRTSASTGAVSHDATEEGRIKASAANSRSSSNRSRPSGRVKSIRYSETSSPASRHHHKSPRTRGTSMSSINGSHSPPGSSGAGSATETTSSFRSSLSHIVRPISSKTRLLPGGTSGSQRSQRRPTLTTVTSSPPTNVHSTTRDSVVQQPNAVEDGFDSWDTSAVDPHNRQTVLESSSPIPGRFLETIPASPTTSRSASPGGALDLEPPRSRRRSRSFSPAGSSTHSIGPRSRSQSYSQSPTNEAHIHPLFRSDSPTPPPAMVSAGTIVTAAPNGGQIITDAQGLRTISRMRSGSLPTVPSPLSRQGSFDDFGVRRGAVTSSVARAAASDELREEETEADEEDDYADSTDRTSQTHSAERKMTPPIPEWILSAGARSSLTDYENRKIRYESGARPNEITPGLAL